MEDEFDAKSKEGTAAKGSEDGMEVADEDENKEDTPETEKVDHDDISLT